MNQRESAFAFIGGWLILRTWNSLAHGDLQCLGLGGTGGLFVLAGPRVETVGAVLRYCRANPVFIGAVARSLAITLNAVIAAFFVHMDDPVAGPAVAVVGRIWRLEVHDSFLWFTCIRSTLLPPAGCRWARGRSADVIVVGKGADGRS